LYSEKENIEENSKIWHLQKGNLSKNIFGTKVPNLTLEHSIKAR
jgi:hypothetical protein